MFSQVFVCPKGGWLPYMHHRSHDQHPGASAFGRLPAVGSWKGVSRGVCIQVGWADSPYPPELEKQVVCILLECFLALDIFSQKIMKLKQIWLRFGAHIPSVPTQGSSIVTMCNHRAKAPHGYAPVMLLQTSFGSNAESQSVRLVSKIDNIMRFACLVKQASVD